MKPGSQSWTRLVALAIATMSVSTAIAAKKPARPTLEAIVISLDGTTLALNAAEEKHFTRITLATSAKTEVMIDGKPGKLADIKPGQVLIVTPAKGTPTLIETKKPHGGRAVESGLMEGAVAEVSGAQLLIHSPAANGDIVEVKIPLGEKTVVSINGKESAASNLKAGQYVTVAFAGGTVRRIIVQPAAPAS